MKTFFRFECVALLLAAISSFGFTKEITFISMSEGRPLVIRPEPHPQGAPRSPQENLFIAELLDGSNSILLGATDTIGTVYVQITSTAGDNYSTYFNTASGAILLPISGNTGYYTLTITTLDGIHYVGEFTI